MRSSALVLLGTGLLAGLLALATLGPALAQGRPDEGRGPGGMMGGRAADNGSSWGPGYGPMMGGRGRMAGGYGQMGPGGSMMGQPLDQLSGDAFDRAFLAQMTMHHAMGVAMTKPLVDAAQHPELNDLARQIIVAQTREIDQMRGWLGDWYGVNLPDMVPMMDAMGSGWAGGSRDRPGAGWHGMGMMGELDDLSPSRREAVFMSLMVPHHQDAIDMASLAAERAAHQQVKDLAQSIIQSQTAENQKLNDWLANWFGL